MLPPIYDILSADAATAALCGNRIYPHGAAPQKSGVPYVAWYLLSAVPQNELDGATSVDQCAVHLDCWADAGQQVLALANAVRRAIEPHACITNVLLNGQEPETGLYRLAVQADFWVSR